MSLTVICYDIVDDRRRDKVARFLLDYGERVQYSVFELFDGDLSKIRNTLKSLIDKEEDSVICYRICKGCLTHITRLGKEKGTLHGDDMIII